MVWNRGQVRGLLALIPSTLGRHPAPLLVLLLIKNGIIAVDAILRLVSLKFVSILHDGSLRLLSTSWQSLQRLLSTFLLVIQ